MLLQLADQASERRIASDENNTHPPAASQRKKRKQRAQLILSVLGWHGCQPSARRDAASHPVPEYHAMHRSNSIKFNANVHGEHAGDLPLRKRWLAFSRATYGSSKPLARRGGLSCLATFSDYTQEYSGSCSTARTPPRLDPRGAGSLQFHWSLTWNSAAPRHGHPPIPY